MTPQCHPLRRKPRSLKQVRHRSRRSSPSTRHLLPRQLQRKSSMWMHLYASATRSRHHSSLQVSWMQTVVLHWSFRPHRTIFPLHPHNLRRLKRKQLGRRCLPLSNLRNARSITSQRRNTRSTRQVPIRGERFICVRGMYFWFYVTCAFQPACFRPVGPGWDKGKSERLRDEVDHRHRCNYFKWSSDLKRDGAASESATVSLENTTYIGKPT